MHPRPLRMMRGGARAGAATNYASIALLNNSTGPEFLIVWFAGLFLGAGDAVYVRSLPGAQGTLITSSTSPPGLVAPLVTGQAPRSGQLYYSDLAAIPAPDFTLNAALSVEPTTSRMPLAVLQPGWSLQLTADVVGKGYNAAFLWESVHTEDLRGEHCPLCTVTISA